MKKVSKYSLYIIFFVAGLFTTGRVQAQFFWIGLESNAVYSWFSSPKLDEAAGEKDVITYDGWGWNLSPFLRYGKRPYVLAAMGWTRTYSQFVVNDPGDNVYYSEDIKLDNFDVSLKMGYELLQLPMFKIDVHGGLFIGKAFMLSGESIYFDTGTFEKPQWGMTTGLGFQFTNLIFGMDYKYHFSELFKPLDIEGQQYKVGARLQSVALKVGVMF